MATDDGDGHGKNVFFPVIESIFPGNQKLANDFPVLEIGFPVEL